MAKPTKIAHPLKTRRGSSQRKRVLDALRNDAVKIDASTLVDRLQMISTYAKRVNHYQVKTDEASGEYLEINDWAPFFEKSLPFQLALFSKISKDEIEATYLALDAALAANVSSENLESLLKYIYSEIIEPITNLYETVTEAQNTLTSKLSSILDSARSEALQGYIKLSNASSKYLCTQQQSFTHFLKAPWKIPATDIFEYDLDVAQVTSGKRGAILLVRDRLMTIFYQLLNRLAMIIEVAPDYVEESLMPLEESLQKKHSPHLALLFTFLELFEYFQGDLNGLTDKHLDFFYQQVLQIQPKEAEADSAHLILEIANHLEQYPLAAGLQLKNGKDANGEDIIFELDEEIVIDKTELTDVKTLYLNPGHLEDSFEGEYIAPIANSKDGKGEKFKPTDAANWASLGDKESKLTIGNTEELQDHPAARIGFALTSPVLLLQEGRREVRFKLDCEIKEDKAWANIGMQVQVIAAFLDKFIKQQTRYWIKPDILDCDLSDSARSYLTDLLALQSPYLTDKSFTELAQEKDELSCEPIFSADDLVCLNRPYFIVAEEEAVSEPMFNISFSGKEAWVQPKLDDDHLKFGAIGITTSSISIEIIVTLDADDPAVVFYDEEILKESLDLKNPFPTAKIELNPNYKLKRPAFGDSGYALKTKLFADFVSDDTCCLERPTWDDIVPLSTYTLFKDLVINNVAIDVEVCGVKNLIVQNDENLQDVNSPILPFGTRPKVGVDWDVDAGANFYIGSKEIFCKDWTQFWITTKWKDKPADLAAHYQFYANPDFEDGSAVIEDGSFRFATSMMEDGSWIRDETLKLPVTDTHRDRLKLFDHFEEMSASDQCYVPRDASTFQHRIEKADFIGNNYAPKSMPQEILEPLSVSTRKGFVRLTLDGVSFQHDRFTFVLTRQLSKLANILSPKDILDARTLIVDVENEIKSLRSQINLAISDAGDIITEVNSIRSRLDLNNNNINVDGIITLTNKLIGELVAANIDIGTNSLAAAVAHVGTAVTIAGKIIDRANDIHGLCNDIVALVNNHIILHLTTVDVNALVTKVETLSGILVGADNVDEGIPNEPYTPTIKSLSIDYTATADISDLDLIHLYPFEKTSRWEDVELAPTLVPSHNHEGSLYMGLEKLTPGNTLNLLFQLAEATADSEADRADLSWSYLSNNVWLPLREGFEVISDGTDGLTVSGIVTIAIPDNITDKGNTIMPADKYWIRVAAENNVAGVAETISIHVQAVSATAVLSEANDTARLDTPLPAESIAKLVEGDFAVKKIQQPFASFGGRTPELSGHYYTRVSEQLRHKGRGQLAFDYERLVLEAFPNIYKAKCISHTMGLSANDYRRDLEVAPGFVVLTVIPDLKKLVAGNTLEPKAPVSLLEKIEAHLKNRISPFARLRVMNPRYEKVNVTISVRLIKGKSEKFYANKLKEAISQFLAPWYLGDSEKIAFGQQVLFSDVVGFVETLDYVDFIQNLELSGECDQKGSIIRPLTARSILTGGEICVSINKEDCPERTPVPPAEEPAPTPTVV